MRAQANKLKEDLNGIIQEMCTKANSLNNVEANLNMHHAHQFDSSFRIFYQRKIIFCIDI